MGKFSSWCSARGNTLADVVYPAHCFLCSELQVGKTYLCEPCAESFCKIGEGPEYYCDRCSEPYEGMFSANPICPNCHDQTFSFEFARSALKNTDEARKLVHLFKYGKQRHLVRVIAEFCHEAMLLDERISPLFGTGDTVIIPVPLHWRRQLQRGFNQAELISTELATISGMPHCNLLKRTRYTTTQTKLARKDRLKNLKNAFQIRAKELAKQEFKQVILIDDVFTTGSTSEACAAEILKECSKVENIVVVTVLRG